VVKPQQTRKYSLRFQSKHKYEYMTAPPIRIAPLIMLACPLCLLVGVGLAIRSLRDPARAPLLERWSGVCLTVGLCLLGVALRSAR